MNWRNSLIALAVLAVLIVVLFIVFKEQPAEEMNASFPEIKKDHVTKIWLKNPIPPTPEEKEKGAETLFEEITLEREGEGEDVTWKLTSPVAYPAYDAYVDTMITRLEEITLADVAVESKANWETLEVDPGQAVHVKVWAGKAMLAEFFLGAYKTGHTMVRMADDERVYKVSGSIRYVFGKRTRDWRDKTVLEHDAAHIAKIEYLGAESRLAFEKQEDWAQVLGDGEEAIEHFDPKKVQSFVSSLARLRAADFADDVKAEEVGLSPPTGEVLMTLHIPPDEPEVKDGEDVKAEQDAGTDPMEPTFAIENVRILVGETKDDTQTYIMLDGNPQIFLVTSHLAERILPEADKFATPPRPEGEAPPAGPPMGMGMGGPPMGMGGPPMGMKGDGSIPPEVMKQVQAEIAKQKMLKQLKMKKPAP